MTFFSSLKRVWNETQEDTRLLQAATQRQPALNRACRFQDYGWYDLSTVAFYTPALLSGLPANFKVCQDCFLSAIAPCPVLSKLFTREIKSSRDPEMLVVCEMADGRVHPAWEAAVAMGDARGVCQEV